ncbi:MAG: alpha/beta fold hydrolase [Acidimicrobiales bacterium]|nr:alpha/beta fold hydrolase [Acidimicrobiales bacterium]
MSEVPETCYATTADGLHIAYQLEGGGPLHLIELSNGTLFSIDATPEQPRWQNYVDRLASFASLIRFDLRGIGLSDPLGSSEAPTVEQWASDALAVLDAEQVAETAVVGVSFGGLAALLLAATHPERVRALILVNSYARLLRGDDYHVGVPVPVWERFSETVIEPGASSGDDLPLMAPGLASDTSFSTWWRRAGHRGASPAAARAVWRAVAIDLRSILGTLQVPTLVVHAGANDFIRVGHGRYLAEHIPNARYVELDTADHVPWSSDADFVGEIEEFLTGARRLAPTDRHLATVLFTDIVSSTEQATALGDQAWKERLELHDRAIDRQLARFGGLLVKRTGDGVLATFDGPARAVQCAVAIRDAIRQVGLTIRAGLHTGEIEQRGNDVAGIAVHLAQRVQGAARPGEVLVSRTVVDLVGGSGLQFEDRGEHDLKGVPDPWRLFSVLD